MSERRDPAARAFGNWARVNPSRNLTFFGLLSGQRRAWPDLPVRKVIEEGQLVTVRRDDDG